VATARHWSKGHGWKEGQPVTACRILQHLARGCWWAPGYPFTIYYDIPAIYLRFVHGFFDQNDEVEVQ
jgi:hypothetical protein